MKKQLCTCTPQTTLDECPHCGGIKKSKKVRQIADFILFSQREFMLNLSRELNRDNVSYAQFFLLGYMANSNELTMSDMARKMGHSTAAATGLVDRLEKLGYVERSHAIDDRRKVMVRITQKGVDLVSRLRNALEARIDETLEEGWDGESASVK